ncbi:MAG: bifunctional [glutamine synthetase] adenylyltransferase/[glutamine synthetase]-adenylyl-L-tyrosine phosphorylase [Rhodospirillales bacterium]
MNDLGADNLIARPPEPADPAAADRSRARWLESIRGGNHSGLAETAESTAADPEKRRLLDAAFGNAPFLARAAAQAPEAALRALTDPPDALMDGILARTGALRESGISEADLTAALRGLKREAALTIALADISGAWPLARVTGALSDFADAALRAAACFALRRAAASGAFILPHEDEPEKDSGFLCLGLGKLGARELNYSSDIDIVLFFDPDKIEAKDRHGLQNKFTRIARDITKILSDRTADGYVFRTDLRLRPDPGATPLCVSLPAAEAYYESQGQNWERSAYIKARACAGDIEAGKRFLEHLRPFIWRRSLDFHALQDIHAIKRQIHAHKGGSKIAAAGHNIKLGRGGIREIEFFAQVQQLIWGGRNPEHRAPRTLEALNSLTEGGLVESGARDELTAAYVFLRTLEHRLQMREDEQTQTLPEDPDSFAALAVFMGYANTEAFTETLLGHLGAVERRYAELFEDQPSLSAADGGAGAGGSLVFTGAEADAETLETLRAMGFQAPEAVHEAVRTWHHGRYRAMRTVRAREILTEITPALLEAFARTADPDETFRAFDAFLAALPAGIQVFSMFQVNPRMMGFIAGIMGEAPRLARGLAHAPQLLDGLLSAEFMRPPPYLSVLGAELGRALSQAAALKDGGFEDILRISRQWAHERQFQISLQTLQGTIEPHQSAWALSRTAEAVLSRLQPVVESVFAARGHGAVAGGAMVTLGYGKLGGRELTPQSDLDMVFVYRTAEGANQSDGEKPLAASHYYARLAQRFISAVTAQTREGALYEADMRLRPSGNAGPVASSLEGFRRYYENDAWTWELMALTRARPVTGPKDLREACKAEIRTVLSAPRDADALRKDIAAMRARVAKENPGKSPWDIKHRPGGLVDIEFAVQYLQLREAHKHPDVLNPNAWGAVRALNEAGVLTPAQAEVLLGGLDLWQRIQSTLHLTVDKNLTIDDAGTLPRALQRQLARLGGVETVSDLEALMNARAEAVRTLHLEIVGEAEDY